MNTLVLGDNLQYMRSLPDEEFDLIYIDPPFNTGRTRTLQQIKTVPDEQGDRMLAGQMRRTIKLGYMSYYDSYDDYLGFMEPRFVEIKRLLKPTGLFYCHLDMHEAHYIKVMLDRLFGRHNFINEIIWAYDYGGRTKKRWPPKHDTILVYARTPDYYFDAEAADREPYMAPGLVGPEKAAMGKLPTDVWWHTIVHTTGAERTGYPTQKPVGVLRRIVGTSCPPGGKVADFFAGSGTTGAAALELGRSFTLVDHSPAAISIMQRRFQGQPISYLELEDGQPAKAAPRSNNLSSLP